MHVSLILEPKGSNANLISMDVKKIYEDQWASNSLSMKFARLQHICQQEQKIWCALTGYRTILESQLELAMRRKNHTMRKSGQLAPDNPYYEARSDNRSSRGSPKTKTGKIMQSNIIITARGVGQNIGSILAKHR